MNRMPSKVPGIATKTTKKALSAPLPRPLSTRRDGPARTGPGNSCLSQRSRGTYDLILQKQRVVEPRRDLSEDAAEELSHKLAQLKSGQMIRVTHYDTDAYVQTVGVLTRFNLAERYLTVVKTHIPLDDIVDVGPA